MDKNLNIAKIVLVRYGGRGGGGLDLADHIRYLRRIFFVDGPLTLATVIIQISVLTQVVVIVLLRAILSCIDVIVVQSPIKQRMD